MTEILETNPFNVDGTILHIGAGQCSELEIYLGTPASAIVLVEPNPDDARILKQRTRQHKHIKVISAAISDSDGQTTLYLCNDERFNGLVAPEKFNRQLPGLRAVAIPKVDTLTMTSLLEKLSLEKEKNHCLVIETRGAEETTLRSLKEASDYLLFEHIVIYASSAGAMDQTSVTSSSLLTMLTDIGYCVEEVSLYEEKCLVYSAKVDELKKKNLELNTELKEGVEENKKIKEQASRQMKTSSEGKKHLETVVRKEVLTGVKQIEAFYNVQAYFNSWESLPDMHGWPISSDFALYLIELLERESYDLILEFGSGTSTALIAKVLSRIKKKKANDSDTVQVAFEHLEKYHEKTLDNLKKAGLAEAVNLELTPLEPYAAKNGNSYDYYNCSHVLENIKNELSGKDLKILLIVDGPPAATGHHARYPAVPIVLEKFETAEIDVLLDDYIRKEEKEIVELWLEEAQDSFRNILKYPIDLEKGACFLSIK